MTLHEEIPEEEESGGGSDRSFGFVFAVVFSIVSLFPLLGDGALQIWPLPIAFCFALLAVVKPSALAPLNRLWTKLGLLLSRIVNPVVLGLLFLFAITPMALIMRLFGKDPLSLRFEPASQSYWIFRDPPAPHNSSMKNQF